MSDAEMYMPFRKKTAIATQDHMCLRGSHAHDCVTDAVNPKNA